MHHQTLFYHRLRAAVSRHWKLSLLVMLVSTMVPMAVLLSLPKKYMATIRTQVQRHDIAEELGVVSTRQSWLSAAELNAAKLRDLLADDSETGFLAKVVAEAQLANPVNLGGDQDDPRLKAFREGIAVGTLSSEVFAVNVTWDDPRECERIAKAIQKLYMEDTGESKKHKAVRTEDFLTKEINSYKKRLEKAEEAVIQIRQTNAGASPEQEANTVNQLSLLRSQMDELQVRSKDAARRRLTILRRMKEINPQSVMEQTLVDDPRAQQLRQLEFDREMLLGEYTPQSDEVRAVDLRIAALKKVLDRSREGERKVVETKMKDNPEFQDLSQQLTEAEIAQKTQDAQMTQLRDRIREYNARIARIPAAQREVTSVMRDYEVLKAQFESLLKQREAVRVKGNLDRVAAQADLRPMGAIYAQSTTSKKRLLMFLLASCVLGFVLAGALVITREWLDTSLYLPEDAERLLELPVLGTVPHMLPSKGS